jgi:hypothetical protein
MADRSESSSDAGSRPRRLRVRLAAGARNGRRIIRDDWMADRRMSLADSDRVAKFKLSPSTKFAARCSRRPGPGSEPPSSGEQWTRSAAHLLPGPGDPRPSPMTPIWKMHYFTLYQALLVSQRVVK